MIYRAKAPLRVSFAGGGTDVPPFPEREGGLVLNATINRYAYGMLRPRSDHQIRIESVDFGLCVDCDAEKPLIFDGKLDLVKAAISKIGNGNGNGNGSGNGHGNGNGNGHAHGYDLFLHSGAPPGSGLGSSSTLVVTIVGLLKEFHRLPLTDYEIADLAYVIERIEAGIGGGLQDQYAATFGGFNFTEFLGDRVIVNPLRIRADVINELEHNMLLCYTGGTRRSDQIIDDQTARFEQNDLDTLAGLRMQKHFAVEMKNALLRGKTNAFGELLHSAWEAKKKMSPKISNPFIEELYDEARKRGALGGKVTGAGGGGYMLLYCLFDSKHRVAEAVTRMGAVATDVAFEPDGLETWSSNGD